MTKMVDWGYLFALDADRLEEKLFFFFIFKLKVSVLSTIVLCNDGVTCIFATPVTNRKELLTETKHLR